MEHFQKITLELGKTIEINGAIIDSEVARNIAELQSCYPDGLTPNLGISENMDTYKRLILFLASEANSFNDKDNALEWIGQINSMMSQWNLFRVPGSKRILTY